MVTKANRHILIFFLLIFLSQLLRTGKVPGNVAALVFIPLIFAAIHLVKSIILLTNKNFLSSRVTFFVAILFALISIKLEYEYYNIVLAALIILLIGYSNFRIKYKSEQTIQQGRKVINYLMVLNIILLFIPDKSVLAYLNYERLKWNKLSWYDFQSTPTDFSKNHNAYISADFVWKVSKVYNYPPAIIVAMMEPQKSWKGETYTYGDLVLEHEQTHFDIVKLYERIAMDSISKCWGKPTSQITNVISFFTDKKDYVQKQFDFVTYGGDDTLFKHQWDTVAQREWTARINNELLR